jgi:TonB-linked SusC/RagA family outer membrane protein
MKKILMFFVLLMTTAVLAVGQTVQISGIVTSQEDGLPIPGVSVTVKGTTVGVLTTGDGRYALTAPQGANTLVFSFIGMKKAEVDIQGRTRIDVVLESDLVGLDEIVVTALGISRERKALGYTVQDVRGDDLVKASNPNVMTSLSGKIAGVEIRQSSGMPGAPSQVLIRGARSFSGNNSPLYVIDGMPISSDSDYGSNVTGTAFSNRAMDLDPNEIESINVLKGQAAAALYGLRASNGVIIITTKKGKGSAMGKPVVTLSSNFTADVVSRLPEMQTEYAQGTNGAFAVGNSYSWGPLISTLPDVAVYGGNSQGQPGKYFDPYKNDWVTPVGSNNPANFFSNNGYTYNNSLNVSGANQFGNYSVGFGATNQTGIIPSTGMDRYTAKMAGDFKLADRWNLGFSGNYADINIKKLPSGNDSWLFAVYGAPPSFDLMGTPYRVPEGTYAPYRQISYRTGVGVNPNWATVNNHYNEATKRFFGNTYLEFKPTAWANIKYQLGIDSYTTNNEDYQEVGHSNMISTAATLPTPTNRAYAFVQPTGGRINNYGVSRRIVNSLLTASFTHKFGDLIDAALLIGNELDHNHSEFYSALGTGFTTPGWNSMSNTTTQTNSYNKYDRRTAGFFGNLSVDFRNLLYFNATGRYDIVSSMPTGNRGFFYPSVSLGFVFTELDPLLDNKILSFGKVRASYAEVGQAASSYLPDPIFVTGGAGSGFLSYGLSYPFGGISGYKPSRTLYDPNLIPQNTANVEFGVEMKFLQNRIGFDYSFYFQNATDQIFGVPLAGSSGYGSLIMNAGNMQTKGHEFIFNATPVSLKNFAWNLGFNFTRSVSKVLELAEGVENISLGGYTTPNIRASAGDTYPVIYGESFVRDDEGRILVNENSASPGYGMPMIGEFKKIGEVSPDFILGVTNSFKLFNVVEVFGNVEWKQGGEMYSGTNRLMDLYGTTQKTADGRKGTFVYPGYKADGTPNDIQRGGTGDENAYQYLQTTILSSLPEAQIYETSFVKIRDLGLNITIPKRFTTPILIQRASIGFVARNILLWTTLPNLDPETSQGQGNMQGGMDYMSLPQTTSYGVNLNLTF